MILHRKTHLKFKSPLKPLKIGLFIASDPSSTGGIQEYVYRLMKEFEKQNHVVTVYGPRTKNKLLYDKIQNPDCPLAHLLRLLPDY